MHIHLRLLSMTCICMRISSQANGDAHLRLLFEDNFEQGSDNWHMTDPSAWRVLPDKGTNVLSLFKDSNYSPPHRSPHNIALVNDISVGDFTFTARVRSTIQPYNHQDITLFFGYQGPANFYVPMADIDMDGDTDADDLDRLYLELGSGNASFDVNVDGVVDSSDVEPWRTAAGIDLGFSGPIRRGDANLDGKVDSIDLNNVALNWQITDAMSWRQGDFNQDGIVNVDDLNDLALNWRNDITQPMAANVPEPSAFVWLVALARILWANQRTASIRLQR